VDELNRVGRLPVHELGAVNNHSLRCKYSATVGDFDEGARYHDTGVSELGPLRLKLKKWHRLAVPQNNFVMIEDFNWNKVPEL
jgi:hypothetical protein